MVSYTNIITNPTFGTNTNGWGALTTQTTTRETSGGPDGGAFLKVVFTAVLGGVSPSSPLNIPVSVGNPISFQMKMYNTVAMRVRFSLRNSGGAVQSNSDTTVPISAGWVLVPIVVSTANAVVTQCQVAIQAPVSSTGEFGLDQVMIETGGTVHNYFDGTYPNAVWTGTAHASTSTLTINAPVVDAGADVSLVAGQTLTRTVSFTDPDTDSWTATVNYGEGAGAGAASVNQGAKTVALSNVYETPGTYTVTVQVTDSYSQSHSDNFLVTVSPAPTDDTRRQRPKRIAILQGAGVV